MSCVASRPQPLSCKPACRKHQQQPAIGCWQSLVPTSRLPCLQQADTRSRSYAHHLATLMPSCIRALNQHGCSTQAQTATPLLQRHPPTTQHALCAPLSLSARPTNSPAAVLHPREQRRLLLAARGAPSAAPAAAATHSINQLKRCLLPPASLL